MTWRTCQEYISLLDWGKTCYLGNCGFHGKRQAGLNIPGQTDMPLRCVDILYRWKKRSVADKWRVGLRKTNIQHCAEFTQSYQLYKASVQRNLHTGLNIFTSPMCSPLSPWQAVSGFHRPAAQSAYQLPGRQLAVGPASGSPLCLTSALYMRVTRASYRA